MRDQLKKYFVYLSSFTLAALMLTACSYSVNTEVGDPGSVEETGPVEDEFFEEDDEFFEDDLAADEDSGMTDDNPKTAAAKKSKAKTGRKISFTTTDIDGNEITSDELFSKHEITMVNVWATWCHWCVVELPELREINKRLAKKDCAIVGLLGDETDSVDEAMDLIDENGVDYLNILPWDGATDKDFKMDEGWPTTYFVDQDGYLIGEPILGAQPDEYEKTIDELLAQRK